MANTAQDYSHSRQGIITKSQEIEICVKKVTDASSEFCFYDVVSLQTNCR